jgi:hypothetical protein
LASCSGSGSGGDDASIAPTSTPTTYTYDARNFVASGSKDVVGLYHYSVYAEDFSNDCVYTFEARLNRISNTEIYIESFKILEANYIIYPQYNTVGISPSVRVEEGDVQYDSTVPILTDSGVSDSNHLTFYSYSGVTSPSDIPITDRSANLNLEFSDAAKTNDFCIQDIRVSLQAMGTEPTYTLYGSDPDTGMFVLIYDKSDWEQYVNDSVKQADIFADSYPGWAGFKSYFAYGSKPTTDYDGTAETLDIAFDAHNYLNPNFNWSSEALELFGGAYDVTVRNITDGSFLWNGFSKLLSTNGSTQNVFLIGWEGPATDSYSDVCDTQYGEDQACDVGEGYILFMHGKKDRGFLIDWTFDNVSLVVKN